MKPVKNLLLILFSFVLLYACRKEGFTSSASARLNTSVDSLHFDTVFTSTGSITQVIKIINPNDKGIRLDGIRLMGGNTSYFRINVDGTPGPVVNNVAVPAEDSIYIFVTVSIDPNAANLPFIVQDSIELLYNGNQQWVQLDAYGQNAHFMKDKIVSVDEIWDNDLPYVILGGLTIDTNITLTINKGCRIHLHADAPVIVQGTLQVNGEKWDSTRVLFTGDRLDYPYRDFPASYPGILFTETSLNNVLNYTIIKNAYQGLVVTGQGAGFTLKLNETIIDNAYDAGILGIESTIQAKNLLVSNCGKGIMLVKGGIYDFEHTTVAGFSSLFGTHREPSLVLTNFIVENNIPIVSGLQANFTNCIFWGENSGLVEDEVVVAREGTSSFDVSFNQVLWRVTNTPSFANIAGAINGQAPEFDSVNTGERVYDFRLKASSPAINKGIHTGLSRDLDGNLRPVNLPDLGAYERQ